MSSVASGEVRWTTSAALDTAAGDLSLQQSRLAARLGHPLALRLNALVNSADLKPGGKDGEPAGNSAAVVIQQAMAVINQTTPDRFRAAQAMLENALAGDADNVDLEIALASHLMRGVQTVWYDPTDVPATEKRARSLLDRALQVKPSYVPALEAYCRFLTATNNISESLVACAKTLSLDPWDGTALFNLGLSEILQGRFEEALATFKQADEYGTPEVSRWTWLLGAGGSVCATGTLWRGGSLAGTIAGHHAWYGTHADRSCRRLSSTRTRSGCEDDDGESTGAKTWLECNQRRASNQERQPDLPRRQ